MASFSDRIRSATTLLGRIKTRIGERGVSETALHYIRLAHYNWTRSSEYQKWVKQYDTLSKVDVEQIRAAVHNLKCKPKISIVMPVYNSPESVLRKAIESVRNQIYSDWELCIADDASTEPHVRKVLEEYQKQEARIQCVFREKNGHISAASNSALELATGDYVALLDHDDAIPPHALFCIAEELNQFPETEFIYSDEDKIDQQGLRYNPVFKPNWDLDRLRSSNYTGHFSVYKTSRLRRIEGWRIGYEGSQDYDLVLRFTEQLPVEKIRHIPLILYHWRAIPGSAAMSSDAKPYSDDASQRALTDHLDRCNIQGDVIVHDSGRYEVRYDIPSPMPRVTIVMRKQTTTPWRVEDLATLIQKTPLLLDHNLLDHNLEDNEGAVDLILTGVKEDVGLLVVSVFNELERRGVEHPHVAKIAFLEGTDFDKSVTESQGELVCLAVEGMIPNNDDWLEQLISHACREDVGIVSPRIVDSQSNNVLHWQSQLNRKGDVLGTSPFPVWLGKPNCPVAAIQKIDAATTACLMIKKTIYLEAGKNAALDTTSEWEALPERFLGAELSFRVRDLGHSILWNYYSEVMMKEDAAFFAEASKEQTPELMQFRKRWEKYLMQSDYSNPSWSWYNIFQRPVGSSLAPKPWKK